MIDLKKVGNMETVIRVVNKPRALAIMKYLYENGETNVTHLVAAQREIDNSMTSQCLARLLSIKMVSARTEGRFVYYTLNSINYEKICTAISNFNYL